MARTCPGSEHFAPFLLAYHAGGSLEDDRRSSCIPAHSVLAQGYRNASYHSCRAQAWQKLGAFTRTLQHLYATFTAPL
jgi:hypothetical protein